MLLSVFALVIALSGPFMTLLVAGFDRKKILLLAILMFLVSGLVSSLSPPFWLLMLVRVIPAFLQPVYIATALSVAVTKGEEKHKNELMSIVFSGIAIAMVSTVPFATWVASKLSWEYSFIIQSLVSVIALIAIYFFLSFLNASTYMISSAPHSLEFANSLATSFGNLGVTLGTTVGGWVIATKGVEFLPWLTLTFGVLAFSMILIRVYLENKTKIRKLQA